jgi:putative ABC transport system ATP-binding protein
MTAPLSLLTRDHDHDQGRIWCEGLVRIYKTTEIEVQALQGLDLEVASGEVVSTSRRPVSSRSVVTT